MSDANDLETEHRLYHEDAVLEYPQSGERARDRRNKKNLRPSRPSKKRFSVRRIILKGLSPMGTISDAHDIVDAIVYLTDS